MATDVGARIGIQGEQQFRSALSNINSQIRSLNSEMRATVSSFAGMEDSEEAVSAQSEILERTLNAQGERMRVLSTRHVQATQRLEELREELDRTIRTEGASSVAAARAQNAYNNQARTVNELARQMNDGRTEINRINREMQRLANGAEDVSAELEGASREASRFGDTLKAAIIGGAVSGLVQSLASSIAGLAEETLEYRKIIGTLETSGQKAGYTIEETMSTFNQLYRIIGDEQSAATAAANFQALGLEQEQLQEIIEGGIGAWATYGDSIPIDGLAEAINETIQVGVVTGTFADVLNWAGTSEDDFNAALEGTTDKAARVQLVLDELTNQGLPAAAEAWRENNAVILDYQAATGRLTAAMAGIGEIITPIITTFKNLIATVLEGFLSLFGGIATGVTEKVTDVVNDTVTGFTTGVAERAGDIVHAAGNAILQFVQGLQQQFPQIVTKGGEVISNLIVGLTDNLPEILTTAVKIIAELVKGILNSLPSIATAGAKIITSLIGGIFKSIPDLLQAGIDIVIDVAEVIIQEIPKQIVAAGKAIVQGLWQGIKDGASWLKENIRGWAGDIVGSLKEALGIHSPSRVMKTEIGTPIIQGISEGMKASTPKLAGTAEIVKTKLVTTIRTVIADFKGVGIDATEGMAEGISAGETEVIKTAEELNQRLIEKEEELTEKLKESGLDEATKEALNKQLETTKTFRSEYEAALNDIYNSQESLAQKLRAFGDLFERVQDEASGKELIKVSDLQEQIDKMKEFQYVLSTLENREAPKSLIDEVAAMDVQDAIDYGMELLKMSEKEFDQYAQLWQQKQNASANIAAGFYQKELDTLKTEYLDKIPQELLILKGQVSGIGQAVGKAITESIGKGTGNASAVIAEKQSEDTTKADVFTKTVEGLTEQQPILFEYLVQLMENVLTTIREYLNDFRDTGFYLMEGVAQGVRDGRSGVVEAVRKALEAAAAAARAAMDINSPSKVFAQIGDYMAQGVGIGFVNGMSSVSKDVAAAMPYSTTSNQRFNGEFPTNGGTDNRRNYSYGDIVLNIATVQNANGRNVEALARDLEFYRRQQNVATGGVW